MIIIKNNDTSYGYILAHEIPTAIKNIGKIWIKHKIMMRISLLEDYIESKLPNYVSMVSYGQIPVRLFPIEDRSIPNKLMLCSLLESIIPYIKRGNNIAINCFGGNGRTGLLVAIIYAILNDVNGETSIKIIRKYKDKFVETKEQEQFVREFVNEYKSMEKNKELIGCNSK